MDKDATPDTISGMVRIYHLELTAVIVQLTATSTAGAVTHMQVWTDSGPAPAWQPFSTLAWLPWQPGDTVHARFSTLLAMYPATLRSRFCRISAPIRCLR